MKKITMSLSLFLSLFLFGCTSEESKESKLLDVVKLENLNKEVENSSENVNKDIKIETLKSFQKKAMNENAVPKKEQMKFEKELESMSDEDKDAAFNAIKELEKLMNEK